jgi:hypothetical protein
MVALTLSALVVLLGHRVFSGVVDGITRLASARVALDHEANARRFLQEAFGSLDVGPDGASGFMGRPDGVEFTTWQRTARRWVERQRVHLGVTGGAFVALRDGRLVTLADTVDRADFDYLLEPGANAVWVREWVSPVSAPLAVRIRIARSGDTAGTDTLVILIGPRG